jgi:hypothetical protein
MGCYTLSQDESKDCRRMHLELPDCFAYGDNFHFPNTSRACCYCPRYGARARLHKFTAEVFFGREVNVHPSIVYAWRGELLRTRMRGEYDD